MTIPFVDYAPDEVAALCRQADVLATMHEARPSDAYRPGRTHDLDGVPIDPADNGALSFHRAPHIYRLLAPGNGFGKSTIAAVEVDWWGFGDHPYQFDEIPRRPRTLLWVSQKFQQFEIQKPLIERWWPLAVRQSWNGQEHSYRWPDGTRLFIITSETDWTTIQGIEPDLVIIDEECDAGLWRELQRRRRGNVRTRYCITATATQGLTWTYRDLYLPWKQWHEQHGCTTERQMMRAQGHRFADPALADVPGIWCWPRGSHADNPTATAETWALEQTKAAGSPVEREVRLYGGYRQFSGTPVFDPQAVEGLRVGLALGRTGEIRGGEFIESGPMARGRLTIYEMPHRDGVYVLGVDFAFGLETGDFDAACLIDREGRQVATMHGHWGPEFGTALDPLIDFYTAMGQRCFIVGERTATGLPILQRWDRTGRWVYFDRAEGRRNRPRTENLGHSPGQWDITIQWARESVRGVRTPAPVIRDEELHGQIQRFAFLRKGRQDAEGMGDEQLTWGAPKGEHDDLARGWCYSLAGIEWLPMYEAPPVPVNPKSFAAALDHQAVIDKMTGNEPKTRLGRLAKEHR